MHFERAPWYLQLAIWGGAVLPHFLLLITAIYTFSTGDAVFSFPSQGLTLCRFNEAVERSNTLELVAPSLKIAALSTVVALVSGTSAAGILWHSAFSGKNAISLLLLLPVALPGIITGLALLTAFKAAGLEPGLPTIVVGHATFCVVIVSNSAITRFRRTSRDLVEAPMNPGATDW